MVNFATWSAGSLTECREILSALGREGHLGGACWGVIRERWIQLLFGFYPPELYWRPILAFILLAVALAPVLFAEYVPKKLAWFSAIYPFLMPWLLWGGSIWTPLLVIAGFVIGWFVFKAVSAATGDLAGPDCRRCGLFGLVAVPDGSLSSGGLDSIIPIGIEEVSKAGTLVVSCCR